MARRDSPLAEVDSPPSSCCFRHWVGLPYTLLMWHGLFFLVPRRSPLFPQDFGFSKVVVSTDDDVSICPCPPSIGLSRLGGSVPPMDGAFFGYVRVVLVDDPAELHS